MNAPPIKVERLKCHKKRRHNTELGARAVGSHIMDKDKSVQLFVYRCPHCKGFHLTRNYNGLRSRVKAWEDK